MTDAAVSDATPGAEPDGAATFEEDPARKGTGERGATPVLRLSAFEGRLDWLLELARARKVDLAQVSLVEIADQLIAALDAATAGEDRAGAAALLRRGDWVVMGAALAELRTRLLAAAEWLDAQAQLGRDVFARGTPTIGAARGRTADLTAFLRACLVLLQAEVARGERYRPCPLALGRVQDAMARMQALLPELGDAAPDEGGASLRRFLPDQESLAPASLARRDAGLGAPVPLGGGQHPHRRPRTRPQGADHPRAGGGVWMHPGAWHARRGCGRHGGRVRRRQLKQALAHTCGQPTDLRVTHASDGCGNGDAIEDDHGARPLPARAIERSPR